MPDDLREMAFDALAPVTGLDVVLRRYKTSRDRHPSVYAGSWIDHLAWGVDSMVGSVRLLFSGQFIGAALVARHQLERWSQYRAFVIDTRHTAGESSLDYLGRLWSAVPPPDRDRAADTDAFDAEADFDLDEEPGHAGEPDQPHGHVVFSDNTEICPAAIMGVLSDIIHTHAGVDAMKWDVVHRCDQLADLGWVYGVYSAVCDALRICGAQIGEALKSVANSVHDQTTLQMLKSLPDRMSRIDPPDPSDVPAPATRPFGRSEWPTPEPGITVPVPWTALLPLHPSHGLSGDHLHRLARAAHVFEEVLNKKRPAGRLFRDDEMMAFCFAWHRYAVARGAIRALDAEREALGDAWDLSSLRGREQFYILTSEAAGVLSGWLDNESSAVAAIAIATSVRSAYWLWLDDDDRAMGVLRTTLEQTARLRTWRRRPDRAAKLEASDRTSPRDWLEASGWRRLEALNRALGELAHTRIGSRWVGARLLLAKLQPDFKDESSIVTARGWCLDTVVSLAAREIVAAGHPLSPALADVLAPLLVVPVYDEYQNNTQLEALLQRAFVHRTTSLGPPSMQGPALEWAKK